MTLRRLLASASLIALLAALPSSGRADPRQSWGPTSANSTTVTPPTAVPASIAGNGTYATGCMSVPDARAFDIFAAVAGTATLQIQRYADAPVGGVGGCTLPVGAAVPVSAQALTTGGGCPGGTHCGDVGLNDGLPFAALIGTVTDTSGVTNAITNVTVTVGGE